MGCESERLSFGYINEGFNIGKIKNNILLFKKQICQQPLSSDEVQVLIRSSGKYLRKVERKRKEISFFPALLNIE